VLRDGKEIQKAATWTDVQVQTGIAYKVQIPGCVPIYEEYDAMVEAGYNEKEWSELESYRKANAIAWYRIKRYIGLHEADAVELKRKQKGSK
jgi:hypothetical protein